MSEVYVVHAFRWGDREKHSYIAGVYTCEQKAIERGEYERDYRGGKYECEVLKFTVGVDGLGEVVKALEGER